MKRKIIALGLAVALIAVAVIGTTLAYLTDSDKAANVFAVGSVDIQLTNTNKVYDISNTEQSGKIEEDTDGTVNYKNIVPTNKMVKDHTVENIGKSDAYVRVAIYMNNKTAALNAIASNKAPLGDIFLGWGADFEAGFQPKILSDGKAEILNLDIAAPAVNADEAVWVYYFKLAPGGKVDVFDGFYSPAAFTKAENDMFDGLSVDLYADAIQTEGFNANTDDSTQIAKNAFAALEEAHPLNASHFDNVVATQAELATALAEGGTIVLSADVVADADTTMVISGDKEVTLNLGGHTISAVSDTTGSNRNLFDVRADAVLNISNGTMTTKHTGANMEWNNSTNIFNVTDGGVLNIDNATLINEGGSDMAFAIHLNNWGEVTLNIKNSTIKSPYVAVRAFNSGYDMNNITIENATIEGKHCLWVHNYTLADFGNDPDKVAAADARLNFDIYGNNNTFISVNTHDNAPIRYGFTDSIYFDANGNEIAP